MATELTVVGNEIKRDALRFPIKMDSVVEIDVPGVIFFDSSKCIFIRPPEYRDVHIQDHTYNLLIPRLLYAVKFFSNHISSIWIGILDPLGNTHPVPLPNLYGGHKFCMPGRTPFFAEEGNAPNPNFVIGAALDTAWNTDWNYDLSEIWHRAIRLPEDEWDETYSFIPFRDYKYLHVAGNHLDILKFWEKNVTMDNIHNAFFIEKDVFGFENEEGEEYEGLSTFFRTENVVPSVMSCLRALSMSTVNT